jgi:hypothetical protein
MTSNDSILKLLNKNWSFGRLAQEIIPKSRKVAVHTIDFSRSFHAYLVAI